FQYNTTFGISELPSSYQWLLFDAMKGDQTLFLHADWIYKAWNIIDPVIKKWETKPWLKLPNYTPGSWGPEEARKLIESEGRQWNIV
ncbi:MAG: glucose-6-phosphate dehydrogenase, partial [Ignavibacteriaceae bacterium]